MFLVKAIFYKTGVRFMTLTLREELLAAFDLATKRHEAQVLQKTQDWAIHQKLKQNFQDKRLEAQKLYESEYDARVQQARQDLLKSTQTRKHEMRGPFGSYNLGKDALERQAHKRVREDHEATMTHINKQETQALDGLLANAVKRGVIKDQARQAFTRTADRRSGQERRTLTQSRS
jgi:hypothetical protein